MSTPSNTNNNDNGKTPTPTAPPSSPMYGDYFPTDDSSFRDQDVGDEALARRLQEEENRLMSFRGSKDQVVPHAEPVRTNTMNIDERYSRKLAQELGDQEIAYGLQQREQQRLDRSQSRQNQLLQEVNARKKMDETAIIQYCSFDCNCCQCCRSFCIFWVILVEKR